MNPKRNIVQEHLKALDPVRADDLDDGPPKHLMEAILATDPDEGDQPATRRRASGRPLVRRWGLASVASALVAALVLAVGLPGGDDGDDGVTAALTDVATAAAAQTSPPSSGPYLFLKTRLLSVDTAIAQGEAWSVYRSETRQEWASPDGAGLVRVEAKPPRFVGPGDRAAWEAAGSPHFADLDAPIRTSEKKLSAGSVEDVSDLPTDPDALAGQLQTEAKATHKSAPIPARTLELIGEALRNPTASPGLRAALYEVALQVPGIEYLGPATDPVGREGLAVGVTSSYSGSPTVFSLVFDPESTAVLANVQTMPEPEFADAEEPIVASATVYLEASSVASLPN